MYWSCLPMGSFSRSISSWQASRASCSAGTYEPLFRGHVGEAVELEPPGDAGHAEGRLEDAVLDLVDRVDDLALGVSEANRVLKAPRDADEHELVDRRGHEEAAVLARVAG